MCGRYTLGTDAVALAARFQAYVPPGLVAPTYNAAPTQGLPTILNANPYLITVSTWGFRPAWADWRDVTPLMHARAETVASKPFFRQAFRTTRCLVLADGFYEWQRTGQGKVPYRITLKTGEPFAFAGIWSLGYDGQRRPRSTFAILTIAANRLVAQLHDRMPVILYPEAEGNLVAPGGLTGAGPGVPEAFAGAPAPHDGGLSQSELPCLQCARPPPRCDACQACGGRARARDRRGSRAALS